MKKVYALAVAAFVCSTSYAKIWRVNNVPGVTADFTTVQLAHDNAAVLSGDTLHIEPSATAYGALTMSKRLTIISVGDFLTIHPNLQYAAVSGRITSLNVNNATAAGSVFHCNFTSSAVISGVSNIRFERCQVAGNLTITNGDNNTVLNCYINAISITNSDNNIVSNNILSNYITVSASGSAIITNNVFFAETVASNIAVQNSTFQNNIINKNGTLIFTNSIVENNLASNTTLPAVSGNVNSVNMTSVFVNPNGNDDASFVLQTAAANPAAGSGIGGVDCGAYGGTAPFKTGLQPAIPAIYKLSAPASPTGSTMNVTFSTRSNN